MRWFKFATAGPEGRWFRVADRLLVVAVLLTAWRLFKGPESQAREDHPPLQPGATLQLPDVRWAPDGQRVVLVLHTKCLHCGNSAPFYREMLQGLKDPNDAQVIVVSQQRPPEMEAWLAEQRVVVDQIVHVADPSSLGLALTPTMLFVGADGVVTDVLLGTLSKDEQEQVATRLAVGGGPRLDNTKAVEEIDEAELERLRAAGPLAVVDIRPREAFRMSARAGAVNIPHDELASRVAAELGRAVPTVIECPTQAANRCRAAARIVRDQGFSRVLMLAPAS